MSADADAEVSMAMMGPPAATATPSSSSAAAGSSSAAPPAEAASSSSYSLADVERVQELIEQGMERYLSFAEIESELHARHRIDPAITRVVCRKLQEANAQFFEHYQLRLEVKAQIAQFAQLMDMQELAERAAGDDDGGGASSSGAAQHLAAGVPDGVTLEETTAAALLDMGAGQNSGHASPSRSPLVNPSSFFADPGGDDGDALAFDGMRRRKASRLGDSVGASPASRAGDGSAGPSPFAPRAAQMGGVPSPAAAPTQNWEARVEAAARSGGGGKT